MAGQINNKPSRRRRHQMKHLLLLINLILVQFTSPNLHKLAATQFKHVVNLCYVFFSCQSQWARGIKRRSAAARRLRFWVRIHRRDVYLSVVSVVCCQVKVSAASWSLVRRSPTDCGASLCVILKPREWGGPGPLVALATKEK
jgi:hypothetical protein